ncbi:hypothetical protein QEN19_004210 [Hanseniaspora menglaensis]
MAFNIRLLISIVVIFVGACFIRLLKTTYEIKQKRENINLVNFYYRNYESLQFFYNQCLIFHNLKNNTSSDMVCLKEVISLFKNQKFADDNEISYDKNQLKLSNLVSAYYQTESKKPKFYLLKPSNVVKHSSFLIIALIVVVFIFTKNFFVFTSKTPFNNINSKIINRQTNSLHLSEYEMSLKNKRGINTKKEKDILEALIKQNETKISNFELKIQTINANKKKTPNGLFFDMTSTLGLSEWKLHMNKFDNIKQRAEDDKEINTSLNQSKNEFFNRNNKIFRFEVAPNLNETKTCDINGKPFKRVYIPEKKIWISRKKFLDLKNEQVIQPSI